MSDERCICEHAEPQHWPESKDQYKLRRCSIIGCDCELYEPAPLPAPQGSGEHKLVADSPTFAYSLAMFLTRDGQRGNAPEMQEEIEMFMRDSRQSAILKS